MVNSITSLQSESQYRHSSLNTKKKTTSSGRMLVIEEESISHPFDKEGGNNSASIALKLNHSLTNYEKGETSPKSSNRRVVT